MKLFNSKLATVAYFFGISAINFIFVQPAISAVSCEPRTISRYSNGSLASCILARDTRVTVSNSQIGILRFPCKAKKYIMFAENSQFQGCKLSEDITIRKTNSMDICPKDYTVLLSTVSEDQNLSIECMPY
ncbi:MAG: hypothetical protein AAFW70_07110 [Cyanobacteria bacterium J06635_10]